MSSLWPTLLMWNSMRLIYAPLPTLAAYSGKRSSTTTICLALWPEKG